MSLKHTTPFGTMTDEEWKELLDDIDCDITKMLDIPDELPMDMNNIQEPHNEFFSPVSVDQCSTEKVVDIALEVAHTKLNNVKLPSDKDDSSMLVTGRWSEKEHRLFLIGLERYGCGNWKDIAKYVVLTRTKNQVASHAQKYFLRKNASKETKKRRSIHDMTLHPNIVSLKQPLPEIQLVSSNMSHQMSKFGNFDIDCNYIEQHHRALTSNFALQPSLQVQPLSYNVSHQISSFGYYNIDPNYTEQQNRVFIPNFAMQPPPEIQTFSSNMSHQVGRFEYSNIGPNYIEQQNWVPRHSHAMQASRRYIAVQHP